MAVILCINLKGGVAKTTNAIAIAECLAAQGKRTLLIDADHQCSTSEILLGQEKVEKLDNRRKTLHDLLFEMMKAEFEVRQCETYLAQGVSNLKGVSEFLTVLPCTHRIDDFQTNYAKGGHGFATWGEFKQCFAANRLQFRKVVEE